MSLRFTGFGGALGGVLSIVYATYAGISAGALLTAAFVVGFITGYLLWAWSPLPDGHQWGRTYGGGWGFGPQEDEVSE